MSYSKYLSRVNICLNNLQIIIFFCVRKIKGRVHQRKWDFDSNKSYLAVDSTFVIFGSALLFPLLFLFSKTVWKREVDLTGLRRKQEGKREGKKIRTTRHLQCLTITNDVI